MIVGKKVLFVVISWVSGSIINFMIMFFFILVRKIGVVERINLISWVCGLIFFCLKKYLNKKN